MHKSNATQKVTGGLFWDTHLILFTSIFSVDFDRELLLFRSKMPSSHCIILFLAAQHHYIVSASIARSLVASGRDRRFALQGAAGAVRVRVVVVRQGGCAMGVAPRERGVRGYQPLLHALLLFHPPILEPDLHLGFVELEGTGYLDSPCPRQVLVEVELLLQLGQLLRREVGPARVVEAPRATLTPIPVGFGFRNCKIK